MKNHTEIYLCCKNYKDGKKSITKAKIEERDLSIAVQAIRYELDIIEVRNNLSKIFKKK